MNGQYFWQSATGGGPYAASTFSDPAPLVYDGNTATGYQPGAVSGGGYGNIVAILIDLGSAPGVVNGFSAINSTNAGGWALYSSNSGTSWTMQTSSAGTPPATRTNLGAPTTARYWQYAQNSGSALLTTEFHLYDAGNTVVAGQIVPVVTSSPSKSQHLFSSGTLTANWTDADSNPVSATFAVLQDITSEITFDRKELWDTVTNSVFPIDCADAMGKCTFKCGNASISADTLQRIVAGQLSTVVNGRITLTLPKQVTLPPFSAVLTLTDTAGKIITANLNLVKALGVSLPFKLSDFLVENFTLDAYPDANGIIGTWVFAT